MSYHKKLIEVSLPLDAINQVSAREKTMRHGHPSTLHLWWARRPLAACRAVLFASLVDDPSEHPEEFPTKQDQEKERERLFSLIEELIQWENSSNESVLRQARAEIYKSTDGNPPRLLDPFAGGGSIPLEAQRLGLEAHASDINPVAVLINKALIEIPPKFAGQLPINPDSRRLLIDSDWSGARGLADDIRYYGNWVRDEAERRIGDLYPKAALPKVYGGGEATVIAWLWARTVTCPNPACGAKMPLFRSFGLSKRKDKEAFIQPHIDRTSSPPVIRFSIELGKPNLGDGTASRRGATCIACRMTVPLNYVRAEGKAGRMSAQMIAMVVDSKSGRIYLPPLEQQEQNAKVAAPTWKPTAELSNNARYMAPPLYGMQTFADLFTPRQLVALTTISDLIWEVHSSITSAIADVSYADAVATYLAFALDKMTTTNTSICTWQTDPTRLVAAFGRQSIPMVWDFAEANPFSGAAGDYRLAVGSLTEVLDLLIPTSIGMVRQADAASIKSSDNYLISTDPPYYDNVPYADLSDFFYVWLRHSLNKIYPSLFGTVLSPKSQELVADTVRQDGREHAQQFFETGLGEAFKRMRAVQHLDYPLTVYYAFKQSETETENKEENSGGGSGNSGSVVASTGWETMLEGLIRAGFTITGTWPMRTELIGNLKKNIAALASSIVLVCRPRLVDAPVSTRREFLSALRAELPEALRKLQHGSIAPVDLAQASIGPGMSIYSRYSQVVESDGTPLRVYTALQMINQELDAALAAQEGEYDSETRWAIAWFEQYGMQEGAYGVAETLSKAKNMSVAHLEHTGLVESRAGKVRLRRREELSRAGTAHGSTVWEVAQRMTYALLEGKGEMGGENGSANILRQAMSLSESVRDLLYRLYTVCERKGWAQEALAYNALVTSWTRITDLAHRRPTEMQQATLL